MDTGRIFFQGIGDKKIFPSSHPQLTIQGAQGSVVSSGPSGVLAGNEFGAF